jgi:hypothetical protein
MLWAQHFSRQNFYVNPPLEEMVCVIFETDIPHDDEHIEAFVEDCYNALHKQYPGWACPYHQGKPPPTDFENWRHSFCSAMEYGPPIQLGKHPDDFRNKVESEYWRKYKASKQ